MDRGKLGGAMLCVLALALTVLFLSGIVAQAYWAIAIPVAAGVVVVMALLFWVGWTFMTTEVAPLEPPSAEGPESAPR